MTEIEQLGPKIKVLRQERGYTQNQLAETLGVSVGAVSKWETGASLPEISMILRLASLFQVSLDFLFDYKVQGLDFDDVTKRIRKLIFNRSKDEVVELIEDLLFNYPNNLEVAETAANSYYIMGSMERDNRLIAKAMQNYDDCLAMLPLGEKGTLKRIEYQHRKSQCLNWLGRKDEAIETLKAINVSSRYSDKIGLWILESGESDYMQEALSFMSEGMNTSINLMINSSLNLIEYFQKPEKRDLQLALEILDMALAFIQSFNKAGGINFMTRVEVLYLTIRSGLYLQIGDEDQAQDSLNQAYILARAYDQQPNPDLPAKPYIKPEQREDAYDNLGTSAQEIIENELKRQARGDLKWDN